MTTTFFKRVAMVSWTLVLLGTAGLFLLAQTPTAGAAFLVAFFSLPAALWSPVGLACAFVVATGRGWTRLARLGIFLTFVAAPMTLVPASSTGVYFPSGPIGELLLRMTVPVYVTALAVAHASLVSIARVGPGLSWVRLASVIAMSMVPIVVVAMVIADSGNRSLFAGLGGLILFALASGVVLVVAHNRRRRATVAAAPGAP